MDATTAVAYRFASATLMRRVRCLLMAFGSAGHDGQVVAVVGTVGGSKGWSQVRIRRIIADDMCDKKVRQVLKEVAIKGKVKCMYMSRVHDCYRGGATLG